MRCDLSRHERHITIEEWVYTRHFKQECKDVLIYVSKICYLRTKCRKMSMTMAVLSEKQCKQIPYYKGKNSTKQGGYFG